MRGKVLVFVATRQAAEDLTTALRQATTAAVDCLHGEKQQFDRQLGDGAVQEGVAANRDRDRRGGARTGRGGRGDR